MERDLLVMIYGAIVGVVGSIVTSIVLGFSVDRARQEGIQKLNRKRNVVLARYRNQRQRQKRRVWTTLDTLQDGALCKNGSASC